MWSGIEGKRVFCRLQHECDVAKITGKGTVVAFIPKRLESWAKSIVWPRNIGNVAIPPNTDNAQSKSSHSSYHKIWKCSFMRFTKRIASLRNHSFFSSPWHRILDCITRHKLYYIKSESAKHWHRISKAKIWLKYFYFFSSVRIRFLLTGWLIYTTTDAAPTLPSLNEFQKVHISNRNNISKCKVVVKRVIFSFTSCRG